MKDTTNIFEESQAIAERDAVYQRALADIKRRERAREQAGYAVMYVAAALAGGYHERFNEPRIVSLARPFCILFALVAPIALVVQVVMRG